MPLAQIPKLFISYSHDSPEHQDRVRILADRLRADGIDAWVDQYAPAPAEGWPMWMEKQIRNADFVLLVCTETYLQRVERREEPGKGRGVLWEVKSIYNALYTEDKGVQRFIPVLFADGQPSWIPLPLQGLTHYQVDTPEGYEDLYRHLTNQPRYEIPVLGERKALPTMVAQSYPASLAVKAAPKTPASLNQRHRQQLLKQVHLDWIEGVLDQSLYRVARIELGLADRPDFVEHPLNKMVQVPDRAPRAVSPNTSMSQIFDAQAGALLILGAPGTGKTTLLLELARDLLVRAEHDENYPIPAVFNLSSWAVRRQSLREWLIEELNERSYVPKKVARTWIESEQVLPLLDGLDEVAAEHREACVEAINNFRSEHGLLPIAVCSRVADYEALGTKLRLRNAVEVQPLTRLQVDDYLDCVGEPLRGLRTGWDDDPSFWELLETPLMLWVAVLAYRHLSHGSTPGARLERRQLFAQFVDAMFRRRGSDRRYGRDQTTRWLSSLARTLARNNQTVFYVENLDFASLPTRRQQRLARAGVGTVGVLSGVLSVGLGFVLFSLVSMLSGMLSAGLSSVLVFWQVFGLRGMLSLWVRGVSEQQLRFVLGVGLGVGLSGAFLKIQPVDRAQFRWSDVSSQRSEALRLGLRYGLIFGLIFGLVSELSAVLSEGLNEMRGLIIGVFVRLLVFGLSGGLIVALIVGLTRLFTSEAAPEARSAVNEGTKRSIRMALMAALIVLLIGVLSGGLSGGLLLGLLLGIFVGLISGGLFALKHLILRLFLWKSGSAPLRYVAFLAQAKELLFLRQVGGGYIFTHRLLRDYFVSLSESREESTVPSA
jgi:hypothetical protein